MKPSTDRLTDSVLLLYLLDRARPIQGNTKLQKTVFLTQLKLRQKRLTGLHFRFFRLHHGPFSKQLADMFDLLAERGFITRSTYALTERGRFLVDLVIVPLKEAPENRALFQAIDRQADWCRPRGGWELENYVYGLSIRPDEDPSEEKKIRDIEHYVDLLIPEPGGVRIQEDLKSLILAELTMTEEQLEKARLRLPKILSESSERLLEAIGSAHQPSE